jgi:guanine nucleotide-binding protein G(i) subunit alpha
MQPDYMPTDQDIVKTPASASVTDASLTIDKMTYQFIEGQINHNKKTLVKYLEASETVIFVADISTYDKPHPENPKIRLLGESIGLFHHIYKTKDEGVEVILILNRTDLFEKSLGKSPLKIYYPDYKGGSNAKRAKEYIVSRFASIKKSGKLRYVISVGEMEANDPSAGVVISYIKDILTQRRL